MSSDTRPQTIQTVDYSTPWPNASNDPSIDAQAADLFAYENLANMIGQSFGNSPPVTQADVDAARAKLAADMPPSFVKATQVQGVIAAYERWNDQPTTLTMAPGVTFMAPIPDDGTGIGFTGRMAQAAVMGWTDAQVLAYLQGMLALWYTSDAHNGTSTPHVELSARIAQLQSVVNAGATGPAPAPPPIPKHIILPHGLHFVIQGGNLPPKLIIPPGLHLTTIHGTTVVVGGSGGGGSSGGGGQPTPQPTPTPTPTPQPAPAPTSTGTKVAIGAAAVSGLTVVALWAYAIDKGLSVVQAAKQLWGKAKAT